MIPPRLYTGLALLFILVTSPFVEAQNHNWIPARQFRAVDRWQRENRKQETDDKDRKSTQDPVASSSPNKGKTKTSPISSDNVSVESGPLLLPPTPEQTEPEQTEVKQPASKQRKTEAPRNIIPAEIPETITLETEYSQGETTAAKNLQSKSPESVVKKTSPASPGRPDSSLRTPSTPEGGTEPATPNSAPTAQRAQGPVTILKPIPETGNSPVRAQSQYRSPGRLPSQPINVAPVQPRPSLTTVPELEGDHWIVSARRCDEVQLVNGCRDCLEFFYGNGKTPLQRATWDEFFNTLQPAVPVSFFVHGSFINWRAAVVEAHETALWIRSAAPSAPVRIVYFTWPSDVNIPYLLPLDVNILGQRSSNYGFHLAHLVGQLKPEQPVTLVGHSHGARLTAATMHLLGGGSIEGERLPAEMVGNRKIRMVLASAAVDRNWLNPGQLYGRALALPDGVLNLRNTADYALNAYPLTKPFGVDSIGRTGPRLQDRMQMGSLNGKLVDVEVAPILGSAHTWPNYYNQPALARAMAPYVFHQPLVAGTPRPGFRSTVRAMPMPDQDHQALRPQAISAAKTPQAIPVDVTPVRSVTSPR